uniref:M23 family metallopeptidase n=1 Tax=Lentilactobacillus hilgardii TaxID=1588 RepID=UPI00403F7CA3
MKTKLIYSAVLAITLGTVSGVSVSTFSSPNALAKAKLARVISYKKLSKTPYNVNKGYLYTNPRLNKKAHKASNYLSWTFYVIKIGGTGINDLGKVIIVNSSDGFDEIYQEFGGMNNIKVGVGDKIRTGQKIATLGALQGAGTGSHVHIGVTKGNPLHKNMTTTAGWYDVTKMHGSSNGTPKKAKKQSALTKLVNKQLASQIKWIGKNLAPKDDDGGIGGVSAKATGSHLHWLEQAGMPHSWWPYVSAIINRESKWDPKANNPTSSAYGIPQALPGSKMRSAGSDWRTNPITPLIIIGTEQKWLATLKSLISTNYRRALFHLIKRCLY